MNEDNLWILGREMWSQSGISSQSKWEIWTVAIDPRFLEHLTCNKNFGIKCFLFSTSFAMQSSLLEVQIYVWNE